MAKKQTRRSISVSRTTYERLKAFCEANNVSMSQLVETRVNDFLGEGAPSPTTIPSSPAAPRPSAPTMPRPTMPSSIAPAPKQDTAARPITERVSLTPIAPAAVPMTSAAARFAVDPPPPIIKPKQETAAPKPAEKRPDQIFTF
jgi:hypothetical protein